MSRPPDPSSPPPRPGQASATAVGASAPSPQEPRVELERFSGPMDLLLHLLREDELDPVEIPVARVCDQFVEHLERLDRIDIDAAGDFLVMASTLMRMKSRALLPAEEQVLDDEELDPRFDLVRQLIRYRRFKHAADLLAQRREEASRRFPRGMHPELAEIPPDDRGTLDSGGADVEALFSAFARLLAEIRAADDYVVTVDDTPMEEHLQRLRALLPAGERTDFRLLLPAHPTKAFAVGMFLALLELLRHGRVEVHQEDDPGAGSPGAIVVEGLAGLHDRDLPGSIGEGEPAAPTGDGAADDRPGGTP